MSPAIGDPVETFTLPGGVLIGGAFMRQDFSLSRRREQPLILAFYPVHAAPPRHRRVWSGNSWRGRRAETALGDPTRFEIATFGD